MSEDLKQLVEVIKELYLRGWLPATSGNFSLRLDDSSFLITPSGKHKGKIKEEDFLVVDISGNPKSGESKPSAETLLHVAIYSAVPSAFCIMHVHSPNATVISRIAKGVINLDGYELLKAFDGIDTHDTKVSIPIFENSQDMPTLAREVESYLKTHPQSVGFLLRSHGVYVWGRHVIEAFVKLEALEFLFECELKLAIISGK
ncbi:MAG: methylthioribulose 1-phosphate dehydratase, partial [Hydrogenobacter sp.]